MRYVNTTGPMNIDQPSITDVVREMRGVADDASRTLEQCLLSLTGRAVEAVAAPTLFGLREQLTQLYGELMQIRENAGLVLSTLGRHEDGVNSSTLNNTTTMWPQSR